MKAPTDGLEIVVRVKPNGDFTVQSNTRDNYRVIRAMAHVAKEMAVEMNQLNGRLVLPQNHVDHFER